MKHKKPDNKDMEEILDIEPVEVELDEINITSNGTSEDLEEDYRTVREHLLKSIIRSSEIMEEVTKKIKGPDGTGYDVDASSKVLKSMADSTKGLLEIHEKLRALQEEGKEETETKPKATLSDIIDITNRLPKRGNDKC